MSTTGKFKAYATYSAALKASVDKSIMRVGNTYLVGDFNTCTEVALIPPNGGPIVGHITLHHLARLGNGNWANEHESFTGTVAERRTRANLA